MTKEEKEEFNKLKHIKDERGFWLPSEETRYYELFDLNAIEFRKKMQKLEFIHKQMEQN